MPAFVNISMDPQKPAYIDAASITGLEFFSKDDAIAIYNVNGRMGLYGSQSFGGLDINHIAQQLTDLGFPMISMPDRHEGREKSVYVSPSAVAYMTVSQPGDNGLRGVITGVKGMGCAESAGIREEELKTLLDAVKAAGKTMLEYTPEQATARWVSPEKLYINPAAITAIRNQADSQVDVYFEKAGNLDVQIRRDKNKVATKLDQQHPGHYMDWQILFNDAAKLIDKERQDFARSLAVANSTLTFLPGATTVLYLKPEEIGLITPHTTKEGKISLYIQMKKERDDNYLPPYYHLFYSSEAERAKSMQVLNLPSPAAPKNNSSGQGPKL